MTDKKMKIGAHTVELSNLDKVLFPDDGITKGDLIDYYQHIAETMLPHLADHPLSLQRFPGGIQAEGFYQKEMPDYFDWIRRVSIEVKEDQTRFVDYLRNAYGQTGVAPYTVRAKPGAPVATPLEWTELADPGLHSQSYTLRNIFHRLGQQADPWQGLRDHARSLKGGRS